MKPLHNTKNSGRDRRRGRSGLGIAGLLVAGVLSAARADVSYQDILEFNNVVTGVRGTGTTNSGNVLLAGSQQISGVTQGLLWAGALGGAGTAYTVIPVIGGSAATSSVYYGPDTPAFNSSIPAGEIRAVGTYKLGTAQDHGVLYQGTLAGSGSFTAIDVPDSVAGGLVFETIPHSTTGDIVVGNYDITGVPDSGNAFIYNIQSGTYTALTIGGTKANSTSVYGAWKTGSDTYVLAGGSKNPDAANVNQAFLATYDSDTGDLSDLTFYTFSNSNGVFDHFEGITAVDGGYDLIATTSGTQNDNFLGAAFAFVAVNSGTFSPAADWIAVDEPGSSLSTGNTVYENTALGIYTTSTAGTQSYEATVAPVPEPAAGKLTAIALFMIGLIFFRRGFKSNSR